MLARRKGKPLGAGGSEEALAALDAIEKADKEEADNAGKV